MATIYGSRALSVRQVAILGAVFEAVGAVSLGIRVSVKLDEWVVSP